jgi:hypothetical protein
MGLTLNLKRKAGKPLDKLTSGSGSSSDDGEDDAGAKKIWSEDTCKHVPKLENGKLVHSAAFLLGVPMVLGATGFPGISSTGNGPYVKARYTDPITKERVTINESRSVYTNGGIMNCAKLCDAHLDKRFRQTGDDRYLNLKHFEIINGQQVHASGRIRLRHSFAQPDTDVRIRHSRTGSTG